MGVEEEDWATGVMKEGARVEGRYTCRENQEEEGDGIEDVGHGDRSASWQAEVVGPNSAMDRPEGIGGCRK